MKNPLRITTTFFGVYAGLLAIQHGIFESLQGSRAPNGLMFNAIGLPCQSEMVWHACFPAMSLIPNLFVTGFAAVSVGLFLSLWVLFFIQRKRSGLVIGLLAILLLLVGGGFVPTYVGIVASVTASRLHAPMKPPGMGSRFLAKLWPWTLLLMAGWFPGSWLLGYFFSHAMLALDGFLFFGFDIILPVLTVLTGVARQKITKGA
jgi:hypothetical protein